MNKLVKRIFSILLVLCMLAGIVAFNASASNQSEVKYHYFTFAEGYLPEGYLTEIVDGILYAYIVENGEAYILNIQSPKEATKASPFVFPTMLGGYPVTSIGVPGEDDYEVFLYLSYTDSIYPEGYDETSGLEYAEYDPNIWASEYIIPEGYKYISSRTFYGCGEKFVFPKSLREISGAPFDYLYTHVDENGEKYTVLPECQYSERYYVGDNISYFIEGDVYFPSRLGSEWLLDKIYDGVLYIPSNYSYEVICDTLLEINHELEDSLTGDGDKGYGRGTTIHCAPDSDFLRAFREATKYNYYTVITDVVPAEYIEFPEETVNVCVGDVVDLEAKTYPAEAIWTACDYTVSDPSIVQIDDYSGRITALKEGTVTVTATHCERGFVDTCTVNVTTEPEPVSGVQTIEPATDTPYFSYGNRDYNLELTGSPSKIQLIRANGATTTIDRSKATITSNGETETWIVNMRVEAGEHSIRAKYGKVWDEKSVPLSVTYDTPKAHSFDITYENGIGTFDIVTDPQIAKIQLVLDNGATLTYSQSYSYIGEDGLRHWTVTRKASVGTNYTLKTKLGYTWTTTDLKATT